MTLRSRPRVTRSARAAALAVVATALAHAEDQPAAADDPDRGEEPVEEIIVRGQQSVSNLRSELQNAREHVYDVFNELNSHDDFDIICSSKEKAGSRIPRRNCATRYSTELTSRGAEEFTRRMQDCYPTDPNYVFCLHGAILKGTGDTHLASARISFLDRRLEEEFEELTLEHPELQRAILYFQAKEREYQETVRRRRE